MSGCLVQDVAKAGITDGLVSGPDHPADRTGKTCLEDARRVRAAFCDRIGAERHAVWFGDVAKVEVVRQDSGEICGFIRIGNAFTHEWLRKTFHRDFAAAVHQVCGKSARAEWLVAEAGAETAPPAQSAAEPAQSTAAPEPPKQRRAARRAAQSDQASAPGAPEADGKRLAVPVAQGSRQPLRLDSFVIGPSNRMAFAAVELAASRPGQMSPLVLHGPSGAGKTHLLEALCTHFRELHPKASAVFLSAEQFTTGFLQALHGSGLPGFRRTCRTADLLVIDDLQFFVGKRATIVEVQHTIEALQRLGRQIVFACDREPEAIAELGGDLLTRLRGGMTARMLPPDEEVRRGIVKSIAVRRGLEVPDDVAHYVAFHMARHARELTGAMNRLEATSHMLGVPITLAMAEDALADLVRSSARSVRLADIERAVCSAFGIEPGSLQSAQRARKVNHQIGRAHV